jgi:23S rRNA A2030 N6-methylase RlmJ
MTYTSKVVLYKQDEFLSQRVDLIAEDQCGNVFIDPRYTSEPHYTSHAIHYTQPYSYVVAAVTQLPSLVAIL